MLADCVRELLNSSRFIPTSLVVVDNQSTDNSIQHLCSQIPGARILVNPQNVGFSRGNNVGARYLLAEGCDFLLFVNPDVIVKENTISGLIDTLGNSPRAGCCGGLPGNEHGVSRMACRTRPSLFEKLVLYSPLIRLPFTRAAYRRHFLDPARLQDGSAVFAICGALMLFRVEAFQEIGGFDEGTFLYEEEFIAGERLARRGWTTVVAPSCGYFHAEATSTGKIPYRKRLLLLQSEQYLLRTHYGLNAVCCFLWRLYRYLELIPGSVKALLAVKASA